jgi:hypothetical protein
MKLEPFDSLSGRPTCSPEFGFIAHLLPGRSCPHKSYYANSLAPPPTSPSHPQLPQYPLPSCLLLGLPSYESTSRSKSPLQSLEVCPTRVITNSKILLVFVLILAGPKSAPGDVHTSAACIRLHQISLLRTSKGYKILLLQTWMRLQVLRSRLVRGRVSFL